MGIVEMLDSSSTANCALPTEASNHSQNWEMGLVVADRQRTSPLRADRDGSWRATGRDPRDRIIRRVSAVLTLVSAGWGLHTQRTLQERDLGRRRALEHLAGVDVVLERSPLC